MKKLLALVLCLVMCVAVFAGCGDKVDDGKYEIGIVQLAPHVALDAATEGFMQAVKDELGEENVSFDLQNGNGDSNTCSTIANQFVSDKVDLIMANATDALVAAAQATKEIPILGTSITEYGVALGIENFTGTVGTNVSGTSDLASLEAQAAMVKEWVPSAKTVGLIYCSTEENSDYQVKEVKKFLEADGLTVKMYPFADSNELATICTNATNDCDAIYVPTDNTVADNTGIINNICRNAKIPVIAGEEGICSGCGIATLSISYYDLGYKTGKMAAQVLKGEADISEMPIAYADSETKKYNAEICQALGITPVEGYVAIETEK